MMKDRSGVFLNNAYICGKICNIVSQSRVIHISVSLKGKFCEKGTDNSLLPEQTKSDDSASIKKNVTDSKRKIPKISPHREDSSNMQSLQADFFS